MKRLLSVLIAALLLVSVLAACGQGSSSTPAPDADAPATPADDAAQPAGDGKTQLNILWWGSQTRHDLTLAMIDKFMELNPDIEVIADYADWDGYWTKLPAQVAGNQTPDVFQMDYAFIAQYVNNGVIAELDSYIADGSLDMSNVSQSVLDSGSVNGKVYGISTGTNAPGLIYRRDILEELNIDIPMDLTLSQYIDICRQVYAATGMRETLMVSCSQDTLRFRLRNYGLNLYNDAGDGLGFDDTKYLVDMWQLALDAQNEGWGMKPGEETSVTPFDSLLSDYWARYQNSNELRGYVDAAGKDIGIVMIPRVDEGTESALYLKPSMFWCVAADSEVKDAAIRYIDFFTNSKDCFDVVGIERAIPISSEIRDYVLTSLDDIDQEVVAYINWANQPGMSSPLMNPDAEGHAAIVDLLAQYAEQVRYGQVTDLEAFAEQFIAEANDILAKAVTTAD